MSHLHTAAVSFRIEPNKAQAAQIINNIHAARFTYNQMLSTKISKYQNEGISLSAFDMSKLLPALKADNSWLKAADSMCLQSACEQVSDAFNNFFRGLKSGKRVGYPKFRSRKHSRMAYKTKKVEVVDDKHIKLPKLGLVRCRISKNLPGKPISATISINGSGKFLVSIVCKDVQIVPFQHTGAMVGVDLGIHDLMTLSDDRKITNPHTLVKHQKKLARLQRRLSRKTRGSKRYEQARLLVARQHEKVANCRADYIHKETTKLIKEYDIICIESLRVANMVKNHKLAKHISDAAFGEIVRQLQYKADWHDRQLVQVDTFYASSQICSQCGHQNPAVKDLKVRNWICPHCGAQHDRDTNAANNILNEGIRLLQSA